MAITETVLEMHYHRPLMELIRQTCGLGSKGRFNFYKYSPQREAFLGFDQAFAMTELSDAEFFQLLSTSATNANYKLPTKFIAYFLQFKVVTELRKRQKQTPPQIVSRPHYRAALDTTRNDRTGFSQHELLFNLNRNDGAMVYYACPMLFEKADLYEVDVSFDPLRLVELDSCPSSFADNSNHYIYFDQKASEPVWCSDPVAGKALAPQRFAERLIAQLRQTPPAASGEHVVTQLTKIRESMSVAEASARELPGNGLAVVADSLTIVQLEEDGE